MNYYRIIPSTGDFPNANKFWNLNSNGHEGFGLYLYNSNGSTCQMVLWVGCTCVIVLLESRLSYLKAFIVLKVVI